jgi:hypothetical protein
MRPKKFRFPYIIGRQENVPKCSCGEKMKRATDAEGIQFICPKGCTDVVVRATVKSTKQKGW